MGKFASSIILIYPKEKEGSISKNKSKLSDSPIFHFYSMDMSILCALISVLASLEIFVNFTLRCTYNKEKPRLFHRNRPDKIKETTSTYLPMVVSLSI